MKSAAAATGAPAPGALPWLAALLALAVVFVWGTNFVVIKFALAQLPPLLLAALRFALAAVPLVFFLPRPRTVSWRNLALYGVAIGVGQFGLLFYAMTRHISPGLASLVIQAQVFFTVALAMALAGERVRPHQVVAAALALGGMALIASRSGGDSQTSALGVLLALGAAFSWGVGNMASRAAGRVNVLAYVAWSSLFAVPPLLVASFCYEGWPRMLDGLKAANGATWAAVLWQSVGNTMFGYGAWAWLLGRYSASAVSPFALLVPVFGMGAAALTLGEAMPAWKLLAAALVLCGLALNLLWPLWRRWLALASR
ncbi:MAG: EamA family transporter [Burkholderiaceae bacterium]|jgi:O-acetylserine/cysteine efflux transporter|nr:EamA family transporter [Burkholderiaceae bacterium]